VSRIFSKFYFCRVAALLSTALYDLQTYSVACDTPEYAESLRVHTRTRLLSQRGDVITNKQLSQ